MGTFVGHFMQMVPLFSEIIESFDLHQNMRSFLLNAVESSPQFLFDKNHACRI